MTLIIILLLLLIPLMFQFNVGSKAVHGYTSLKFWKVCIISFSGLILAIIASFFVMLNHLSNSGIKDGLPLWGVFMTGVFIGMINLVIIGIQLYTKWNDK